MRPVDRESPTLARCPICEHCPRCKGTHRERCMACPVIHDVACPMCEVCGLCGGVHLVTPQTRAKWITEKNEPPGAA